MARSLLATACATLAVQRHACHGDAAAGAGVVFRTLVDLATGDVAGIEAAHGLPSGEQTVAWPRPFSTRGMVVPVPAGPLCASRAPREAKAYLVRGNPDLPPERMPTALGVPASRIILMYDVARLLDESFAAIETLLAAKRLGMRILLDHFDLEDPPVRFLEMAPADILRVSPALMPWHWEESRRLETMASLTSFAANLLMDVAVEGVAGGQCPHLHRLGVRYTQGRWRRDVPDVAAGADCDTPSCTA